MIAVPFTVSEFYSNRFNKVMRISSRSILFVFTIILMTSCKKESNTISEPAVEDKVSILKRPSNTDWVAVSSCIDGLCEDYSDDRYLSLSNEDIIFYDADGDFTGFIYERSGDTLLYDYGYGNPAQYLIIGDTIISLYSNPVYKYIRKDIQIDESDIYLEKWHFDKVCSSATYCIDEDGGLNYELYRGENSIFTIDKTDRISGGFYTQKEESYIMHHVIYSISDGYLITDKQGYYFYGRGYRAE